ncbi:MAG: endonuclease/exonuclease/phosphatase family protein [Pseudomonadota bacterium]
MSLRIATFNAENLMARFDFSGWKREARRDRSLTLRDIETEAQFRALEQARVVSHEDDARQMTALAIADCRADIVCLQEVEDLDTLEAFERNYLLPMTGLSYPQKEWRLGNDGRGIDVALMARETTAGGEPIEIRSVKSHAARTMSDLGVLTPKLIEMGFQPDTRLFRRDCLEVNMKVGGRHVTAFVAHFKSMGAPRDGLTGRDYTMPVRQAEAAGVRRIVEERFGAERCADMRWMICGDLNDYPARLAINGDKASGYGFDWIEEQTHGSVDVLNDGFSDNLVDRRPQDDRWTLFYANGRSSSARQPEDRPIRHLVQLDYILASPRLAQGNLKAVPEIIRNGQPYRTVFPPGQDVPRYPRTGWDRPKASDHCPVVVELEMV